MNNGKYDNIPLECIRPSTTNPRKDFNPEKLAELAANIQQVGLAQPILVRPIARVEGSIVQFEIVAGERRFRASKLANTVTIAAVIKDLTDVEALRMQVVENLHRRDLHELEEAEGYEQLMKPQKDGTPGYTADELAEMTGRSKSYIYGRLKLCALEPSARKVFYDAGMSPSDALIVARIPVPSLQAKFAKEIAKGDRNGDPLSHREVLARLHRDYMLELKTAPFKTTDDKLLMKVGACTTCPKRTGNQAELFSDVKSADICTDPVCFQAKRNAWSVIQIKRAKEAGQTVIEGADAKKVFPHQYSPNHPTENFKTPDSVCYDDSKNRTYGQLAKLANVATVVVKNPHDSAVVELIKVDDIKSALKEMGVVKSSSASSSNAEQVKKAKAETAFRTEVFAEVRANAAANGWTDADWHVIAETMLRGLETNDFRMLLKILDWDESLGTWEGKKQLAEKVQSLSMQELSAVLLAASLINEVRAGTYNTAKPEDLLAAAGRHGVDVEKIRARLKAEEKAKADAKKKPAAKKAVAKPAKSMLDAFQESIDKRTKAETKKAQAKPAKSKPVAKAVVPAAAAPAAQTQLLNPAAAWPFPSAAQSAAKKATKTAVAKTTGKSATKPKAADNASQTPVLTPAAAWPFPIGAKP
jgi:ParB/RepB/Spo0J family partition protein